MRTSMFHDIAYKRSARFASQHPEKYKTRILDCPGSANTIPKTIRMTATKSIKIDLQVTRKLQTKLLYENRMSLNV
jgi:hypothetical protein